jgi:hypothetical protein
LRAVITVARTSRFLSWTIAILLAASAVTSHVVVVRGIVDHCDTELESLFQLDYQEVLVFPEFLWAHLPFHSVISFQMK